MRRARLGRAKAMVQHARVHPLDTPGSFNLTAAWTPLGPSQTVTPAYGNVTGRVTSIAVDGSDATGNTIYVGTTGGGVWKSTNAAGPPAQVSFAPLTDQVPAVNASGIGSLSIGALSVQPPGGMGVVLAGTGDPNDALDSYYGEGILRSMDNGATWTAIDEADKFSTVPTHSFVGEGFAGFAWSTSNANLVVAAVTQAFDGLVVNALATNSVEGLYYSTDAGATWELAAITDGAGQTVQSGMTLFSGYDGNAVTSVVWNPVRKMFYAAIRYHGYYDSPDGMTWTRLADQDQPGVALTSVNCPTNPGATGAVACPMLRGVLAVQPVTGDMFAMSVNRDDVDQGIWWDKCTVNGIPCSAGSTATFGTAVQDAALEAVENGVPFSIAQADYDLYLAAVPSAGDTLLYAGTEDIYKCSLANGCVWRNTTNVTTCAAAEVAPSQHAVATGPMMTNGPLMFFGNDSGLWRTTDGINQLPTPCSPDDATHFDNLNGGLGSLAEVTDMAEDPANSGTLMVAQGANGTSATTTASGALSAWPQVLDGFGAYVAIDPANASNWYAASGYGVSVYYCGQGGGCDAAQFPDAPLVGDVQTASDGETLENPAVWMLDPQDTTQMIVGTCRVWRGSVTGGSANWTATNALSGMLDGDDGPACDGNSQIRALAASGTISTPAYPPGTTQEILYAGMDGTLDGGETAAGHVYTKSVPAGATGPSVWADISQYPSLVVNDTQNEGQFNPGGFAISSVVVDTQDARGQTVYATVQGISGSLLTEPSVYLSTNGGQGWTDITANLPEVPVNGLVVDPGDAQVVYLATDAGVYVTTNIANCATNQLQCWSAYGTAMPDAPVTALTTWGTGSAGISRAATYGRGVWQTSLLSAYPLTSVALSAPSLTFGSQAVDTESASQTVTITNNGSVSLIILPPAEISEDATGSVDFTETDNCSGGIPVNGICTLMIAFEPTTIGTLNAVLTLIANVPGGQVTVALSGTGTPAGPIVLTPTTLPCGSVLVGKTVQCPQSITISNTLNSGPPVPLQTPTVSGDYEITSTGVPCPSSLAPNSGCTVSLAFTPTKPGTDNGMFSIVTGDGTLTAQLTGTGLALATDGLSASTLLFGPQRVGTVSAAKVVTISNTGDFALTLIKASSNATAFAVTDPGCQTNVPGHGSCAVSVTFAPTTPGAQSGTLTISDALHTQTVTLNGTGVAPAGVPSVSESLVFPAEGVAGSFGYDPSTLTTQPVTLTNNGITELSGLQFQTTGDFAVASGTCPTSLASGAACIAQVTFTPTVTGPQTGTLTVTGSNLGHGLTTALSGEGLAFSMDAAVGQTPGRGGTSETVVSPAPATYMVNITPSGASAGTLSLDCTGAPANYTCTASGGTTAGTVALANGNPSSVTVTVAPLTTANLHRGSLLTKRGVLGLAGFGAAAFACVFPFWPRRRNWVALAAGLLVLLAGCGLHVTGGSGGGSGGGGGTGTPSSYTLVLTASAPGVKQSVSMTLVVEQ
jgi:hypothetical protein